MRKRLVSVMAVAMLGVSMLTGCTTATQSTKGDTEAQQKVEKAFDTLKNYDKSYQVSNVLQAPDGNLCYLEVVNKGASYTEYPVDSDGNYGTIAFQNRTSSTEYVLNDWVTAEGKGYAMTGENEWSTYPDDYSQKLVSRKYMYFDTIQKNMTDVKFKETKTIDIGMGDEEFDLYEAKLDKEKTREILGVGSEQLYKSIRDNSKDSNIKHLCDLYLDNVDFTMVFSDANITIGVSDDTLRYIQLEVGGLGTRLYMTKSILTQDVSTRKEPDFTKAKAYEKSMTDMAEFMSKYETYDEGMTAWSEKVSEKVSESDETEKPSEETEKPSEETK